MAKLRTLHPNFVIFLNIKQDLYKVCLWINLLIAFICKNNSPLFSIQGHRYTLATWQELKGRLIRLWPLLSWVPSSQFPDVVTLTFHSPGPCQHFPPRLVIWCQQIPSNQQSFVDYGALILAKGLCYFFWFFWTVDWFSLRLQKTIPWEMWERIPIWKF